jgi:REP element-mobilizing transposase RayT
MTPKAYPQRKSPRLKGYDYRQEGAYFVTICTAKRTLLFGDIVQDEMHLNTLGIVAHEELQLIPQRWQTVDIDLFIVMPNHIHVIIVLVGTAFLPSADTGATKTDTKNGVPTLGHVVGNYKSGVTRIARQRQIIDDSAKIWQVRYHDHIIRDDRSLDFMRRYIVVNTARWQEDTFYGNS